MSVSARALLDHRWTDELSDGTGRQPRKVWKWHAQTDCFRHKQQELEKLGHWR